MPTLVRITAISLCIALLGGLAWLLVRTFPSTPAGWYWYTGELLFAVPAAILILHAGVQQCVPPARSAQGHED
jgi:hypothetical protein